MFLKWFDKIGLFTSAFSILYASNTSLESSKQPSNFKSDASGKDQRIHQGDGIDRIPVEVNHEFSFTDEPIVR